MYVSPMRLVTFFRIENGAVEKTINFGVKDPRLSVSSLPSLLCDLGKGPSLLWASMNWWLSSHRPHGILGLLTLQTTVPNLGSISS